jgi:ribosomal protein L22
LNEAIKQMEFSHKKASKKIMHSLITAKHHAELYKKMNVDNCYIGRQTCFRHSSLKISLILIMIMIYFFMNLIMNQ